MMTAELRNRVSQNPELSSTHSFLYGALDSSSRPLPRYTQESKAQRGKYTTTHSGFLF